MEELKKDAHTFAHSMSSAKYGQATKLKICKKSYFGDTISSYYAGALTFVEIIKREHVKEKFKNVDEMLGFIDLVQLEGFNNFATRYCEAGKVRTRELGEFYE